LTKVADLLRPGGWWVMVWNDFGDPDRTDPFHEATKLLLAGPSSPSIWRGVFDSETIFSLTLSFATIIFM